MGHQVYARVWNEYNGRRDRLEKASEAIRRREFGEPARATASLDDRSSMPAPILKAIEHDGRIGVFTRNHSVHLEEAFAEAQIDHARMFTFRARKKWKSALAALEAGAVVDVYFATVSGDGMIEFVGDLVDVVIDPQRGDERTEELLGWTTASTREEGLWEKEGKAVQSLYVVRNLRRPSLPLHMTSLIGVRKGEPIDQDYKYSYSITRAAPMVFEETVTVECPDLDLVEHVEGRRRLVQHLRRERNAALVRRKKRSAASLACEVCGFDSLGVYGVEFCEVHHLEPLSLEPEARITRLGDLAILCANCHRAVHTTFPPLSLEELRRRIYSASRSESTRSQVAEER